MPEVKTTRLERKFQEAAKTRRNASWLAVYLVVLSLGLWIGLVQEDLDVHTKIYALLIFLTGQTMLGVVRNQMTSSLVSKLDEALGSSSK